MFVPEMDCTHPAIPNGGLNVIAGLKFDVFCMIGYELQGAQTMTCGCNGWSYDGDFPVCASENWCLLWFLSVFSFYCLHGKSIHVVFRKLHSNELRL